ncbi:MAG: hypothetical protein HOE90_13485 [Bacteriovoracaceae bacterium]|jgi:hypothetical protein|nr:hypothetical protein [Bacteriovoracaceae bacterium]
MRWIFLILVLFYQSKAYALICDSSQNPFFYYQHSQNESEGCEIFDELTSVAHFVDSLIPFERKISAYVEDSSFIQTRFDEGGGIFLQKRFIVGGHEQSLQISRGLWAHELAHWAFFDQLAKYHPDFLKLKDTSTSLRSAIDTVHMLVEQEAADSDFTNPELLYEKANKQFYDFRFRRYKIIKLLLPFAELHADVIAALYSDDLDIIEKVFTAPVIDALSISKARARSFSRKVDSDNWGNEPYQVKAHSYFTPTRSFLGSTYLKDLKNAEQKASFTENLTHLFCQYIVQLWNDSKNLENPSQDNKQFIKYLQNHL